MREVRRDKRPPPPRFEVLQIHRHVLDEGGETAHVALGSGGFEIHGVSEDGDVGADEGVEDFEVTRFLGGSVRVVVALVVEEAPPSGVERCLQSGGDGSGEFEGWGEGAQRGLECPCEAKESGHGDMDICSVVGDGEVMALAVVWVNEIFF